MRQERNGTSEGGRWGTAPHPEPAEPGLLARISKQCQEQRGDGGKDSVPLSPPQKGAGLGAGGEGTIVRASEELGFGWRERKRLQRDPR